MQAGMRASTPAAIICPKIDREFGNEGQEADREGRGAVAGNQHQGKQQLAPCCGKDKPQRRGDAGKRQRQDDLAEGLEPGGAVDHRRLFEILRNAIEEGLHQEGGEGHVEGGVDDDQAGKAVSQAERRQKLEDRRHQHDQRKHLGDQQSAPRSSIWS